MSTDVQDYKLYAIAPEIARIIRENTDLETGEISEQAVEEIVALEEHAEFKIHNCGQVIRDDDSKIVSVKEEIKKLRDDLSRIEKHREGVEQYLIRCAETLNIDKVFVDGRTTEIKMSRDSVQVDSLEDLDPEYVVTTETQRADKRGIMQFWRSTGKMISGAKIFNRKIVKV